MGNGAAVKFINVVGRQANQSRNPRSKETVKETMIFMKSERGRIADCAILDKRHGIWMMPVLLRR
jgi:hypothetical protein